MSYSFESVNEQTDPHSYLWKELGIWLLQKITIIGNELKYLELKMYLILMIGSFKVTQ